MKFVLSIFILSFYLQCLTQEIDTSFTGVVSYKNEFGNDTSAITYFKGKKNGEVIKYKDDGTIEFIGLLFNGKRHGTNIWYDHYDSNSYILINYNKGIKEGEWIMKTSDSKVRGFYRNNEKDGIWYYYKNEKLKKTEEYDNGNLVSSIFF